MRRKVKYNLICQNCNREYVSKAHNRKICYNCEETIVWWIQHSCSVCGYGVKTQGRSGRGIECGCNENFYKNHFSKMREPGLCTSCGEHSESRTSAGLCNSCLKDLQSRRGLTSSNKIGKLGLCSNKSCKFKGKNVLIANSNGYCEYCSLSIIGQIGRDNAKVIGSVTICPICNKENVAANLSGMCYDCLSTQSTKLIIETNKKIFIDGVQITEENLHLFENIKFDGSYINFSNLQEIDSYKGIGSIGLTGVFKEDGKRYALTAGKSNNLSKEIRKFIRILNSPEKQTIYGQIDLSTGKIDNDYGRWYDITHNYTDFQIEILYFGNSESEALKFEALWALRNNATFKYDCDLNSKNFMKKIEGTHGYWLP